MFWRVTIIIAAIVCLIDIQETAAQAPVMNVILRNPNAVFAPQEAVIADIALAAGNVSNTRQYPISVVLTCSGKTLAELETVIIANAPQMLPVSFVAPANDGIYEIVATVKPHAAVVGFLRNITETPLVARQQFAVVNSTGTPRTDGDLTLLPVKRDLLDNSTDGIGRRNLLQLPPVHFNPPGVLRIPTIKFGSKEEKTVTDVQPSTAALKLPIPIDDAGKPYLLEIEYPLNTQQQLGAVIEDESAVISATKIDIDDEIVRDKRTGQSGTHKILFRPKSKKPFLTLVNLSQPHQPPVVHSIRIAGLLPQTSGEVLRIPKRFDGTSQRKFIGIIDGDILKRPRLDLATAQVPPLTVSSVFDTVNHLTDVLCHNGYDGLMLTVSSSTVQLPDSALEMLFRQFDRDQLTLIPVVKAETLDQQHTLQDIVVELTEHYRHHPSFGGVSVFQNGRWSAANVPNTALFYHPVENGCISVPADYQNRRRFVKQLTQSDVLTFFDGGEQLPVGEQDSLCDLLAAYRKLPPLPFKTLSETKTQTQDKPLQPLTVRYLNTEDGFYVYLVNDAPYEIDADIVFDTAVQTHMTELSGRRMIRSLNNKTWRATLLPYDFLAVKLDSADTSVQHVSVIRPPEICGENGRLKELTDELGQRIYAAKTGVAWDKLPNAGFEEAAMAGWLPVGQSTFSVSPDTEHYYSGTVSAKLTNQAAESGSLMTEPLSPPRTGRLWIAAFVGIPVDASATRIPLNFVLTAEHAGKAFYRHAAVGDSLLPNLAKIEAKNSIRWRQVIVPFEQLPTDDMKNIRIGFQVTGQATLWIDDVKIYPVAFSTDELKELQRMMLVADTRFRESRFSELLTLLEGQQSRFLFKNVPLPVLTPKPVVAAVSAPVAGNAKTNSATVPPPEKATMYQRVKGWFGK